MNIITRNLPCLRYRVKCLIGRDILVRPEIGIETERYGGLYSSWATPKGQVNRESVIYSFGVGEDASWDLGLISKHECEIHAFDPTPRSKAWIRENIADPRFIHHDHALSDQDGTLDLWLPLNADHVSATCGPSARTSGERVTVSCRTLSSLMRDLGHDRIDVLKMDIEGAEYRVIRSLEADAALASKIDTILIEFHHWMPPFSMPDTHSALASLRKLGYRIGWVSETGHELMFTRPEKL
jgi:FkbM family methyltransferase